MRRGAWIATAMVVLAFGVRAEDAFVEGKGERGLTLGYHVTPQTRIEADFALTATRPHQMRVFGADADNAGLCCSCYVNSSGEFCFGAGDRFKGHPTGVKADLERHVAVLDFAEKRVALLTGGKLESERTISVPCTRRADHPLAALARTITATGRTYDGCARARVYGLKIFENGRLVRDFVPATQKGVPGLRDRRTGFFAENGWRVPHWRPILSAPGALTDESGHVQGICRSKDAIYLTMMGGIAKIDWHGRLLAKAKQPIPNVHTGDICLWKDRLYTAVCCFQNGPFLGKDEKTGKPLRGCLQMMDLEMNVLKTRPIQRPPDGIVCLDGVLYVGLSSAFSNPTNQYRGTYFGKYDAQTLEPLSEPFVVDCGCDVWMGVQNLTTDGTSIYANYYVPDETVPSPNFIRYDKNFKVQEKLCLGYGQGVDFVPGGGPGASRFLCCDTVNWLDPLAREKNERIGLFAYLTFWEVKEGCVRDISVRNGYVKTWERW